MPEQHRFFDRHAGRAHLRAVLEPLAPEAFTYQVVRLPIHVAA